jgi:hypothetical protein
MDTTSKWKPSATERPQRYRPSADDRPAYEFLERLRPGGPWLLTAIIPDGVTKTITAHRADEVDAFVRAYDGERNLYYSLNPTWRAMSKKAEKGDIAAVEYIHADLDPEDDEPPETAKARYRDVLKKHEPAPTAIVDSGNGIQALWRLAEPITLDPPMTNGDGRKALSPLVEDIEARTAELTKRLGGKAGTQNIDRILRLPGTTNLPNEVKRKRGRTVCQTKLLWFEDGRCALDDFPKPEPGDKQSKKKSEGGVDIDRLPISKRMKDLIRGVDDPDHPYETRSERVFAVLVAMAGAGCSDAQTEAVMLNPLYEISAHILDQPKPAEYLARQIVKARKQSIDPDVAELNDSYALVIVGDKTAILKEEKDDKADEAFHLWTVTAFNQWHANKFVTRGDKWHELAKYWLKHPQRRQYEGLEFAPNGGRPGYYNLWKGFSVEPKRGDCSKFLAHLRDNVCRGNERFFRWVVGWFAQIIQHPEQKLGTSLGLRGKQGVGKTKVGEVIGSLFKHHSVLVSDPRYVTGRFNSHLVSCLLLHADEAFWAGDKQAEGTLKNLVTGHIHFIELKGKDQYRVRNYIRLFVTGNKDWLVPAAFDERRFALLDVGEDHIQDHPYFEAIDREMDNGGREALLHYLLNFDLSQVDLRIIPKTKALLEQKIASLNAEQSWWLDTLMKGELPGGCAEIGKCPTEGLFESYLKHAERQGTRHRSIQVQIGTFLQKHVRYLKRVKGTYARWDGCDIRGPVYVFPPLQECRDEFSAEIGQTIKWQDKEDWTYELSRRPERREW